MPKRFAAFLIALLLLLPTAFTAAEADSHAQNPFEYYDKQRDAALEGSVSEVISRSFIQKSAASYASSEFEGSEYIIRFNSDVTLHQIYDIVKDYDYRLLAESSRRLFCLVLSDSRAFEEEHRDYIYYIEESIQRDVAAITNDPLLSDTWAYEKMDVFGAWNYTAGKSSVVVAVLDTGINRYHEDFSGASILQGYDAVNQRVGVTNDSSGHGTMVSGLIAATANNGKGSAGISYGVTLMPVKVSSSSTTISSSNLVTGLYFAADAGAKVINMSLGGYSSSYAEEDAIKYSLGKGCILVASSGNDGDKTFGSEPCYPASYSGVISVGSVGTNGTVSNFSQYNQYVDVVAPGENIIVMKYSAGVSSYVYDYGTSFSAAFVSGIAALAASYLDAKVSFGSDEFLALIKSTGGKRDDYYGYGSINAVKILELVNLPIVSGVTNGETYFENVTVKFNRGAALLDGETIYSGEVVFENGLHVLEITYGTYKKTITFSVDNSPLVYNYREENSYAVFTFDRGSATLNGFPYASGQQITTSGEHRFVLSGSYNNSVNRIITLNYDLPYVLGVTDGAKYDTAVCIRIIGAGSASINGTAFTGETVIGSEGNHTLTVTNSTGSRSKTYSFKIENSSVSAYKSDLKNASAIVDAENGYLILYSDTLQGVRVYDINDPTAYKRYLNIGRVKGYAFYGQYLLIFHENSVTRLARSRVLNQSNPVDGVINPEESISACMLIGDELYYVNQTQLKRINLLTQTKGVVAQLDMYADTAFSSLDGNYFYFFDTGDDGKDVVIFDLAENLVLTASMPVTAFGKKILYDNGRFAVGNTVLSEKTLLKVAENSSTKAVRLLDDLLFTERYIINAGTNVTLAVFESEINDVFVGANNKAYVFFADGTIKIITNSLNPITAFSPAAFRAAAVNDIIVSGGSEVNVYSTYSSVFSGCSIVSFAVHGNRIYMLCEGRAMLYVLDTQTLVQIEGIPLNYIPRHVTISGEKVYVSFKNAPFIYTALAGTAGFGTYLHVGFIPSGLVISDEKLVVVKEGTVVVVDLVTMITTDTGRAASGAFAADGTIYISNGSIIYMYDLYTFAAKGSIAAGINISTFSVSGNYIFAGGRVYSISGRKQLYNTGASFLAHKGNALFTDNGIFNLANGEKISTYSKSGVFFRIDDGYNYYIAENGRITRITSASGRDITEVPVVSGIVNNGVYTDGVTIEYPYGVGYIGTEKVPSGSQYTQGGEHTFMLVLSFGISTKVNFLVVPAFEGIAIIGGDRQMSVDETISLKVQFLPAGTSSVEVIFDTKNNDIVKVDTYGRVTALKLGVATVRAMTLYGDYSDECIIIVSEALIRFDPLSDYKVDRDYDLVMGVPAGTRATTVLSAIITSGTAEILDHNGNRTDGIIGTGMSLVLRDGGGAETDRLIFSIKGDISGDGYISAEDLYCLIEILANTTIYNTAAMNAADINDNGRVANGDMTALRGQLLYYSDTIPINETPPVRSTSQINALVKTNVYYGEKVVVTLQISGARDIYAVSGRMSFDTDLLEYVKFTGQSWNDTVYIGDGFISFVTYEGSKQGSDRSLKTLLVLEFTLKEGSLGKQLVFGMEGAIAVNGESFALEQTQTFRTVLQKQDKEFNVFINNIMDFAFSKDTYEYRVTVPHTVALLDIEADYPLGASVIVGNTLIPDSDKLTVRIIYIDPEGNSYSYYINVTREKEPIEDDNCFLAFLSVEGYQLFPLFDKSITKYTLTVPYTTEDISISFNSESHTATTEISDTTLKVGVNTIEIKCIAENGDSKVYTIIVTREAEVITQDNSSQISTDVTPPKNTVLLIVYITLPVIFGVVAVYLIWRRKKAKR